MHTLTLMMGIPRSGKTDWVNKNKKNAVVVSSDWIRENILGCHYFEKNNAIVWSIIDSTLRVVLGQGKDAIFDGMNLDRFTRKFFIDLARDYNAKVKIVFLDTPLMTCIARNAVCQKIGNEKLEKLYKKIERPLLSECDEIIII